jgi:hypothetical protein
MADIFGRNDSPFAGAFAADASKLVIGGQDQATHLVQNLSLNYSQNVNTLFEIGSNNRYYVVGRTTGQFQWGRIIGPTAAGSEFLALLGNPCSQGNKDLIMNLGNAACNGITKANINLTAKACVLMSVGYSMQAQDMLINEQLQGMFGQLNRTFTVA